MSEILIICAVALLVFGPEQLPEMIKKVAKGLKEVRRASDDFKRQINLDDDDRPRWRPPVPDPALTSTSTPPHDALAGHDPSEHNGHGAHGEPPPAIPGSALSDPPLVVRPVDAVAVGSVIDVAPAADGEATDPQKPSSLSSQAAQAAQALKESA